MKFAKKRRPIQLVGNGALLDILRYASPFGDGISGLLEEPDDWIAPQDEPPEEVRKEIGRLAAIACSQILQRLPPPTTWVAGVGRGLLRQGLEHDFQRYWRDNGCLPSGVFHIPGRGAVQLDAPEGESSCTI